MFAALERGTTIGRLRVRAAARDAAAVRMRSEAVLRDADLQPSSLPPHAILCIRSFADPLPGALDLDPRHPPSARWHLAARASLDSKARRAVRPVREAVPAAAEAVVFMDWAELLACAARDALRGELALHWWWQHLLAVHDGIAGVARELVRQPRYVPAVIELLARRRDDVVAFARAVAASERVRIIEAVLRENSLPELAYSIVTALTTTSIEPPSPLHLPIRAETPRALARVAPEAFEETLAIEQRLLIAVPLLLRRAPSIARAAPFQQALIRWIASWIAPAKTPAPHEERPVPAPETHSSPHARPQDRKQIREDEPQAPHSSAEKRSLNLRQPEGPSKPTAQRQDQHDIQTERKLPKRAAEPNAASEQPPRHTPQQRQTRTREEHFSITLPPAPPRIETAQELQEAAPDTDITSDFAGALFLINAGIALGLYSDFTAPLQRGIDLDLWQFVALLARAIAGEAIDDDPLSDLLIALRCDEEPAWTPPPVLAAYPGAPDDPLARWIEAVANHLRLRLGDKLARALVAQHGRITTTPAHVDAWFSLVKHPIEIRLTGLDRDPGWVPAAGHHVAFHFD
jgi:hypothetical protein